MTICNLKYIFSIIFVSVGSIDFDYDFRFCYPITIKILRFWL